MSKPRTAEEKDLSEVSQSIILDRRDGVLFGVIVDSVVKMAKLEDPTKAPEKSRDIETKFMKRIVIEDEQDIVILDFERLLYAS